MRLESSEPLALVGPNGVGNSTLLYLLCGFHHPRRGSLFAGGIPYEQLDMHELRRQIGIVSQDPLVFSGTIARHIGYGIPDTPVEKMECASEAATAHEFICRLPDGYNTVVGGRGMLLFGGQRQRIAVARALMRRSVLLILGEPTNHLNSRAMRLPINNLRALNILSALLLISHDPAFVREARRLYRIENGGILAAEVPARPQPNRIADNAE